jgi:phage terminase large subunit-like protein
MLDDTSLDHWRQNPCEFIEQFLVDPEINKPYKLLAAERLFLQHMFTLDADGRLLYSTSIYSAIKKSGKSTFAAMIVITMILLFGGRYAEGYICANDKEQATDRVYEICRRIVEASPLLQRETKITNDRILFPATGATITPLSSDYASAAGGHPTIAVFDELWGFSSERSRRLWDELCPVPTRKISCRLVVSHAGFENESPLFEELYQRGLALPLIAPDLYGGDGQLMFWSHTPIAPWQCEAWLAQARRDTRPNQYLRQYENRFVSTGESFIDMADWDRYVDPNLSPSTGGALVPIWVGVDASTKHDSSAIVAVTYDSKTRRVRLVTHKVLTPTPGSPISFDTIEATLLDWKKKFQLRKVVVDPYQMAAVAERLRKAGIKVEEYAQTSASLMAASQNLYELIHTGTISVYPNSEMRLAISRAVALESNHGWRLGKEKHAHKVDVVIALAMAAHAAVESRTQPLFGPDSTWIDGPSDPKSQADSNYRWRLGAYMRANGIPW